MTKHQVPDAVLAERERERVKRNAARAEAEATLLNVLRSDYGKLVYVRVSDDGRYLQMTDPTTLQGCDPLLSEARGWREQVRAFVERLA